MSEDGVLAEYLPYYIFILIIIKNLKKAYQFWKNVDYNRGQYKISKRALDFLLYLP